MSESSWKYLVFVTGRREYHFRGEMCVAVRDRGTRHWNWHHAAIRLRATCLATDDLAGGWNVQPLSPVSGGRIYFADGPGDPLLTGVVHEVRLPTDEEKSLYANALDASDVALKLPEPPPMGPDDAEEETNRLPPSMRPKGFVAPQRTFQEHLHPRGSDDD